MKFLHAADIHLDSPLTGLFSRPDVPDTVLRHCTRRAFSNLIDLAVAEDVSFLVIAGDLYDGDWRDFSTGLFFAEEMRRLKRPCFVVRGNHDARSVITKTLTPPPNVHEFPSDRCVTVELDALGVALHGRSFPHRAVTADLSAGYAPPVVGLVNIGVLHTSAEDPGEHEVYAPCRVSDLAMKGYAYWALGHIHARRILHERPWIVFPGNTQGRHPNETGAKGATLVTVEEGRIVAVEHRAVDVLRWLAVTLDVAGTDVVSLTGRIADAVADAVAGLEGRPALARVTLKGATELHTRLAGDAEWVAAECRAAAIAADANLTVESVRVRTELAETFRDGFEPLHKAFDAALGDREVIDSLLEHFDALRRRLPAPARAEADLPGTWAGLRATAAASWDLVTAALRPRDQG